MSLVNLVPEGLKPSAAQADVLLELAYLTTAADGQLTDEELNAFQELASSLRGTPASNADVDALLDRYAANVDHAEIIERVQKIAPTLEGDLRALSFKLAVGLSVIDLDASDEEADLQATLAEALGLDATKVDELTAEVYASLDAGE